MSRPIGELSAAIERVAGGELTTRVTPKGALELRSLGDSFNQMTERLLSAREALQQAEREAAWRDVARKLAHEFKNILTPMKLSLQLLECEIDSLPEARRTAAGDSLHAALREVGHLERLAEQFFQYARLPEPQFERVDLAELVETASRLSPTPVHVSSPSSGLALVRGDRLLLSRAVHNLLLNACEASPPGAEVETRPSCAAIARRSKCSIAAPASRTRFVTGCSIPTSAPRSAAAGSGSRWCATSRASTAAWSRSRTARRRRRARVPRCRAARAGAGRGALVSARLEVLVVDDDGAIRDSLRRVLEHAGHDVTEAETGDRAIELLEGRRMDAVLLDLNMPGISGLDALTRIRELAPDTGGDRRHRRGDDRERDEGRSDAARSTSSRSRPIASGCSTCSSRPRGSPSSGAARRRGSPTATSASWAERGHARADRVRAPHRARPRAACSSPARTAPARSWSRSPSTRSRRALGQAVREDQLRGDPARSGRERAVRLRARRVHRGAPVARRDGSSSPTSGTLFLDEIGDLSLGRAGEAAARDRDRRGRARRRHAHHARSTCASSPPPTRTCTPAIESGDFRQDLFYRLNVLPVHVPPLRERRSDVPLLAEHFLSLYCEAEGKPAETADARGAHAARGLSLAGERARAAKSDGARRDPGRRVRRCARRTWRRGSSPPDGDEEPSGLRAEIERREADAIQQGARDRELAT